MAHFYGTLQGGRRQVSRLGGKLSGITAVAASWDGCIRVRAFYNKEKKEDWVNIRMDDWQGQGESKLLYLGPIGHYSPKGGQSES